MGKNYESPSYSLTSYKSMAIMAFVDRLCIFKHMTLITKALITINYLQELVNTKQFCYCLPIFYFVFWFNFLYLSFCIIGAYILCCSRNKSS